MRTPRTQVLYREFCERTLPKLRWTHEAHLTVCWYALAEFGDGTVPALRERIRAYNDVTGVPNTLSSGYHETLTEYFVQAVRAAEAPRPQDLWRHLWCSRSAPGRHWSPAVLFSPQARTTWVSPDLEPLPWHLAGREVPAV